MVPKWAQTRVETRIARSNMCENNIYTDIAVQDELVALCDMPSWWLSGVLASFG